MKKYDYKYWLNYLEDAHHNREANKSKYLKLIKHTYNDRIAHQKYGDKISPCMISNKNLGEIITPRSYRCNEFEVKEMEWGISYRNNSANYKLSYRDDYTSLHARWNNFYVSANGFDTGEMIICYRDWDYNTHNPFGPAVVDVAPDGTEKKSYYIQHIEITDWLEQKGYTLPLSDKQKYEFELKFL